MERPKMLDEFMRRRTAEEVSARDLHARETNDMFTAREYVKWLYGERQKELLNLEATDFRAAVLTDDREAMNEVLQRRAALREILPELEMVLQELHWRINAQATRRHWVGLKEGAQARAATALSAALAEVQR